MSKQRFREDQVVAILPNCGYGKFVRYVNYLKNADVVVYCYDHDNGDQFPLTINALGIRKLTRKERG